MNEIAPAPGRTRGLLLLGLIFMLGMACGAALFYMGQRSLTGLPPWRTTADPMGAAGPGGPRAMEMLTHELELDTRQRAQVREILAGSRLEVHRLLEDSRSRIREILREDQRQRFDALPLHRPHHRRGPGWGPPPDAPPDE